MLQSPRPGLCAGLSKRRLRSSVAVCDPVGKQSDAERVIVGAVIAKDRLVIAVDEERAQVRGQDETGVKAGARKR